MNANKIALRVVASPRFAAAALLGFAALCMAALDVPQGLADREVLLAWSHGIGPFITVLGLNHLGRGLLPWALLAALVAHGLAVVLQNPGARPRLDRWTLAGGVLLLVAGIAFGAAGLVAAPLDLRDPTRLTIEPILDQAPGGRQVVEEGAIYQLPGASGPRIVAFGVTSLGPWAAERRSDGVVVAHLPADGAAAPATSVSFRVDARRPSAVPPDALGAITLPMAVPAAASLLASLAAAVLLVLAGRRAAALPEVDRRNVLSWLSLAILGFLVNPLAGPGRGEVPIGAGTLGAPVLNAVMARTPLDVAGWVGSFPAVTFLEPLRALLGATALALVLVLLVRASAPRAAGFARIVGLIAGALAIATAVLLLGYAVGHVALPDTFADLTARFQRDVLPRLPASLSVLEAAPTQAGPYVLPLSWGLLASVGPLAAWLALIVSLARKAPRKPLPIPPFAVLFAVLVLVRAASLALAPALVNAPAGAVPVALASALLAAVAVVAGRLHPDRESAILTPAILAAVLQLTLVA